MRGQRLDASQRLRVEEELDCAEEAAGLLRGTKVEAHHGAEALLLPDGQLMLPMALQAGIGQASELGLRGEEFGDGAAIFLVGFHPQRQRLDAAQNEEALEGGKNSAGGLLDEEKALLVLGLRANERAAEAIRVAVEKLGRRVHDDVRAERQWALQNGGHEGVVHADLNAVCMGYGAHRGNVGERHDGVGRRLDVNQLGRGLDGGFDGGQIAGVDIRDLNAVVADDLIEQPLRAAIHIVRADDVIARVERGYQRIDGRHAAAECMPAGAAFESCKSFFKANMKCLPMS